MQFVKQSYESRGNWDTSEIMHSTLREQVQFRTGVAQIFQIPLVLLISHFTSKYKSSPTCVSGFCLDYDLARLGTGGVGLVAVEQERGGGGGGARQLRDGELGRLRQLGHHRDTLHQ